MAHEILMPSSRNATADINHGVLLFPPSSWEWYGSAAHFICGRWCRFHMATKVGPWLVSTVGEYVHPQHSGANEQTEAEWLKDNWPGEDIGCGRKYETMVFGAGDPCECGCGLPTISGSEQDFRGANTASEARINHMALCMEWANRATTDKSD